jgi:hypothetical protein
VLICKHTTPDSIFFALSRQHVLARWMNGEEFYEPLYEMIKDFPNLLAKYA